MAKILFFKNPRTRKEYKTQYEPNFVIESYGNTYIYNPSLEVLHEGMMIRAWKSKSPMAVKEFGVLIKEIDPTTKKVLMGVNVGGTLEAWIWVDIEDLKVAWTAKNLRTFPESMEALKEFSKAVRSLFDK